MPRVFISYSHDSADHRLRVLELANRLRTGGVEAVLDRYTTFPTDGWPQWMLNEIDAADFIVVVCTPTYKERFEGGAIEGGLGARWEGLILSQALYDDLSRNRRFIIPILFDDTRDAVPRVLRSFTVFQLPQDYEHLYGLLTGQHEVTPPPLGILKKLPVSPVVSGGASGFSTQTGIQNGRHVVEADPTIRLSPFAQLRTAIRNGSLVLNLGPGVGVSTGMQVGYRVLQEMFRRYIVRTYGAKNVSPRFIEQLMGEMDRPLGGYALSGAAELIQSRLPRMEFAELLREAMYESAQDFKSDIVSSIVKLVSTQSVKAVVVHSYDDVIVRAFREAGIPFHIVHGTEVAGEGMPVIFPNGYLPRAGLGSEEIDLRGFFGDRVSVVRSSPVSQALRQIVPGATFIYMAIAFPGAASRKFVADTKNVDAKIRHLALQFMEPNPDRILNEAVNEIFQATYEGFGIEPIWLQHHSEVPEFIDSLIDSPPIF